MDADLPDDPFDLPLDFDEVMAEEHGDWDPDDGRWDDDPNPYHGDYSEC